MNVVGQGLRVRSLFSFHLGNLIDFFVSYLSIRLFYKGNPPTT